jgi:hypothetical protein
MAVTKFLLFLIVLTAAVSLQAGPKGYFRTEKGALIKGEVMYVDDAFYYCRRVSNPEEMFTIKIEKVPVSFRRVVNGLRQKGEITTPPKSVAKVEVVEQPYGEWQLKDYSNQGHRFSHLAILSTKHEQRQTVWLVVRYGHRLEVFLKFSDQIAMTRDWQVTCQFDNDDPMIERWRSSISHRALFSPRSSDFRNKLLESDYLSFDINDKEGETYRLRFNVSHFDRVYKDLFESVIDE